MIRTFCLIFILITSGLGVAFAQVGGAVETGHAKSRLVSATMAAAPGETVTLAIVQQLDDHWHVYWQNPGDSGLPLVLDWSVPDGYEPGEIAYPLPHRLSLGPLVNFGHEGEPVFLIDLAVPGSAVPGSTVPISVEARWLICYDVCIPEEATLNLLLPIAQTAGAPTIGYDDRIAAARAEQPQPAPFDAAYHDVNGSPVLRLGRAPKGTVEFYPYTPSLIEHAADVDDRQVGDERWLSFVSGFAYDAASPEVLAGVLIADVGGERTGYVVRAPKTLPPQGVSAAATDPVASGSGAPVPALGITLLLAILGGVVLNIMPCVFPIVFLKAAAIAKLPRGELGLVRQYGLLYTLGVLAAFLVLSVLLIALRAGGEQLGWGFHLQSPVAVGIFSVVLFAIGLNLAGLFEVGQSVQGLGDGLAARGGRAGAFFTGLLAVVVAAPCIGPFLGGAVGVALTTQAWVGVLIFLFIGIGLALPYLLVSFVPGVAGALPRPGPWMETAKQLFSFAMFATVVWLVWVLSIQAGSRGVAAIGVAFVATAFAGWLLGRSQQEKAGTIAKVLAGIACIGALVPVVSLGSNSTNQEAIDKNKLAAVPYSDDALSALRADETAVFVDFTAAWCVSCQFNKRTVLDSNAVVRAFHDNSVTYMVADWTLRDPDITKALEFYGRAGVPLYLYFAPNADGPIILPALLSRDVVLSAINGAN